MIKEKMEAIATGEKYQRVKTHLQENKRTYLAATGGAAFAGITCLIVRGIASQSINRDVIVTAGRDAIVARKRIVMRNVSFISAERQGSPSWVVRLKETGEIFTSQRAAAAATGVTASNISRQLNGLQENAQGLHFERICLAV
jgi:hypothetical protein